MQDRDLLLLTAADVQALLAGRELEVIERVRRAYVNHAAGNSALPHSTFLHFPNDATNRIIALPAYLGGEAPVAGLKWIASFPGNRDRGLERASAVVVLNCPDTGRPRVLLEGSIISARRTAASAALAARTLHDTARLERAGIIGCGLINGEVVRFLRAVSPVLRSLIVHDTNPEQAARFASRLGSVAEGLDVHPARSATEVLAAPVVSMATTALQPHLSDLSHCPPGALLLHLSLRDLSPECILGCDNVVDDIDHVCRAQTSVHLAEQLVGHRCFIRCCLADVLTGADPARTTTQDKAPLQVFSPFGLGILDLAVAQFVWERAQEEQRGILVPHFLP